MHLTLLFTLAIYPITLSTDQNTPTPPNEAHLTIANMGASIPPPAPLPPAIPPSPGFYFRGPFQHPPKGPANPNNLKVTPFSNLSPYQNQAGNPDPKLQPPLQLLSATCKIRDVDKMQYSALDLDMCLG
ncbi:hypothetical protein BDV23DRAFT_150239 [Aspergillus alliaceus]|uniref:Uncharacterized protein n=1 Tax=Petromyces alliaceus TaxID=209559 RepID=A0A5N7CFX0_PETAA|nr:hypothetical protein BDV23DRAFT_150239 [Aspergillus alliaceus]